MKSDIAIAQEIKLVDIKEIGKELGINPDQLILFGNKKAKLPLSLLTKKKTNSKLILVSAISPTRSGEGKTTTAIALAQGLKKIGQKVIVTLREPSLGPVFGLKGGATGGGYSQVLPMADINLHFNGDFHALTSINNLISSVLDNHLFQGNALNIDPTKIFWKRCLDLNDRVLRDIKVGFGDGNGIVRDDHFIITVASEVMAIFCLSYSLSQFKERIGRAIIALDKDGKVIRVSDLKITGALATLVYQALQPNLVQTNEQVPAIIHGGPFANIAHGCNSIIAARMALGLADYVVTEAGFGFDLGGEKFMDITCRAGGFTPDLVVLVVTIRGLKFHGSGDDDRAKLINGIDNNLRQHLKAIDNYGVKAVVTINRFADDLDDEVAIVDQWCTKYGIKCRVCQGHALGGDGARELARAAVEEIEKGASNFRFLYDVNDTIENKIFAVCNKIYGANGVKYSDKALESLKFIKSIGEDTLPICIAKTPLSLTDDPNLIVAPATFDINISDLYLSAGAGFIVVLTGKVLQMPGLPARPAAEIIDIDDDGVITGLF